MNVIPQNLWLEALGWTIINSWWQFGILWLIWKLIQRVWPGFSSSHRYILALIVVISGSFWSIGGFLVRILTTAGASNLSPGGIYERMAFTGTAGGPGLLSAFISAVSIVYLIWIGYRFTRLFYHFSDVTRLVETGLEKMPVNWRLFTENMAAQMNLPGSVKVWISRNIDTPVLLGWLKPVVLLPATALTHLSTAQLEAVLIHELAHIKRNDYLWNWIIAVIENLFFFNPFVLGMIHALKQEREFACDDWVLQFPFQPKQYAEALLLLEQRRSSTANPLVIASTGHSPKLLLARVRRMLNLPVKTTEKRMSVVQLAILLLAIFSLVIPSSPVTRSVLHEMVAQNNATEVAAAVVSPVEMEWSEQSTEDAIPTIAAIAVQPTDSEETDSEIREAALSTGNPMENLEIVESPLAFKALTPLEGQGAVTVHFVATTVNQQGVEKAFTMESDHPVDLPEEATGVYLHPYVPAKSFESRAILDTLPDASTLKTPEAKAQEAALQTKLALEKLDWQKLQVLINKLQEKGEANEEAVQLLIESELAKLNWSSIQKQATLLLKEVKTRETVQQFIQLRELEQQYDEQNRQLNELSKQLEKAKLELQKATDKQKQELDEKQQKLLKKHKIIHI